MRLFVALDLDDNARQAIAVLQQRIAKALGSSQSMKMVDPARMHLTLAFLGEIAESKAPPIVEALSINFDFRSFAVEFQGVGVFPRRGAPRVLWLGVGHGASEIIQLEREVVRRLEGLGITLEQRPFHPHLTLARWRTSRPADRRHVPSDESRTVAKVTVDRVTLYQSRLSAAGPAYTALTRATLT